MSTPMKIRHVLSMALLVGTCGLWAACGGGGGDDAGGGAAATNTGQLIDGRVQGVAWASGGQTGVTDENGTFSYTDTVSFCLGEFQNGQCEGIDLGTGSGKPLMRPFDFSPT